jgi:hypothetical protein
MEAGQPSRPRFARRLRMSHFLKAITTCRHAEGRPGTAGARLEARTAPNAAHSCPASMAGQPFEYNALNYDDNDLKIVQIRLYHSGTLKTGPVGASRRLLGGQTFQPEREILLQICCRCSEGHNGLAMLAPASSFCGDQPLPGVVVNLRRQADLVKIEIAAPQLGPAVAILLGDRVNDDFDQDGSPASRSAIVP